MNKDNPYLYTFRFHRIIIEITSKNLSKDGFWVFLAGIVKYIRIFF